MVTRLFGTDGIRGEVIGDVADEKVAIRCLLEDRTLSPTLMRVFGEALARASDNMPGEGAEVVIGWDERPCNPSLVNALTLGLRLAGCSVTHVGLCSTPALHYAVLTRAARAGCMITASHNPVSDSGVKVFDSEGYKSTPKFEDEVSSLVFALSEEERECDEEDVAEFSQPDYDMSKDGNWASQVHPIWLTERTREFSNLIANSDSQTKQLLLDSSKGHATTWLGGWLEQNLGIAVRELSQEARAMNDNCGAGELSPSDTWTIEEARQSEHLLIRNLSHAAKGTIVAAALDGDGDRCLLILTTEDGYCVVDGDMIGDRILCASKPGVNWKLAASIESDLALLSTLDQRAVPVEGVETAVGDRWLAFELRKPEDKSRLLYGENMPAKFGLEDSGHIVMPSPHPSQENHWTLVGDGAFSLVATLLCYNPAQAGMERGWKLRKSVKDVDRGLWDGQNALSDEIEALAKSMLMALGELNSWQRSRVEGEPNLMILQGKLQAGEFSLGIRNSGTQAKTSVSLRLSPGLSGQGMEEIVDAICEVLADNMC